MIALSKEIQQAVQESEDNLVRLIDPETNVEYVVLPAETFEQMRNGVYYDDGPITEEERRCPPHSSRASCRLGRPRNGYLQRS